MALIVRIEITTGLGTQLIQGIQIRRTTPPHASPQAAADDVHDYEVTSWTPQADGTDRNVDHGLVRHRYGDGAQALVAEAVAHIAREHDPAEGRTGDGR